MLPLLKTPDSYGTYIPFELVEASSIPKRLSIRFGNLSEKFS